MKNICVFIDLNKTNYNFKAFEDAITKLKNRGQIVFGKLYNFSPVKHKEYLDIVRKLDFEVAPESKETENKRNKDVLDIREIVDILNFVNSKTNLDVIYLVTCDGNVIPLLKSLKIKNLYVIGSFDYFDKENMDMCNETFDYNLFKQKPVKKVETAPVSKPKAVKKSTTSKVKKSEQVKTEAKKAPAKKTVLAKKQASSIKKPAAKKAVQQKTTKAKKTAAKIKKVALKPFDLSRRQGESEEEYFIRMLNSFAKRTNSLNFEFNKDVDKKKALLADINKFVDEQKAIQNGKKRRNPEIMSVIRELGNLASDIKATIEINGEFTNDALKTK